MGSGAASRLHVSICRTVTVAGRVCRVAGIIDPGSRSRTPASKAGLIIALLALLLGAVVVIKTMAMAVIERRQQFGLLSVVGWSRGRIARLILGEAMAVSLVGAVVGLGLGVLASELVVRALTAAAFVSPEVSVWVLAQACSLAWRSG